MKLRTLWFSLAVAMILAPLPFLARAGSGIAAADPLSLQAVTAEDVVGQIAQGLGGAYAGDCATAASPRDLGKLCSKFVGQRGTTRAYLLGRTFSEFTTWAFVTQTGATWQPLNTVPFDTSLPAPQVPWPG